MLDLKYEHLLFLCFACVGMGHLEKDCVEIDDEDKKQGLVWGAWLKASPCRGRAKEIYRGNSRAKIIHVSKPYLLQKGKKITRRCFMKRCRRRMISMW